MSLSYIDLSGRRVLKTTAGRYIVTPMSYHLLAQEGTAFSPWQVVIHPSIHPFICPPYLPYCYLSPHLSTHPPIHPPNVPLSLPCIHSSSIHIYSFLFLSFSHSVISMSSVHTSPPFIFPHNSKRPFFPSIHPLILLSTHEPFRPFILLPNHPLFLLSLFYPFSFHPFIHLSLHHLSSFQFLLYPSIILSLFPSISFSSIHLSTYIPLFPFSLHHILSTFPYMYLSTDPSIAPLILPYMFLLLSFAPFINVLPFHFQFMFQQSVNKYRVPPLCLTRNYETTPERI